MKLAALLVEISGRLVRRMRVCALRPLFASCGKGFIFDPDGCYSFRSIHLGDDANLGYRPIMMAALSKIRIGDHVMFGPEVIAVGGGHNAESPCRFMTQVHEKTGHEDLGVAIEDDVWVGARAVILRGVTVGRGPVVGPASVVAKSVPPYAIVAGNPARVVRFRWDVDTIVAHEQALYPDDARLSRSGLERYQADKAMLPPRRVQ